MNFRRSNYRILLVMAALGALAWGGAAWADERPNFEACGTATITDEGVPFEEPFRADLKGVSPEFGPFTGKFESDLLGLGQAGIGVARLDFDDGTLVLAMPNELGADSKGHGGWLPITVFGTGIFEGVTGGGTLYDYVTPEGDILFFLEGTLVKLEE